MDVVYLTIMAASFGLGLISLIGGIFDLKFIDSSKNSKGKKAQDHINKRFGAIIGGVILLLFGVVAFIKR